MASPFGKTGEERTGHYISIKNDQSDTINYHLPKLNLAIFLIIWKQYAIKAKYGILQQTAYYLLSTAYS